MRHKAELETVPDGLDGRPASGPAPLGYLTILVGAKPVTLTRKECIEILKRGRRWRKHMVNWKPERST